MLFDILKTLLLAVGAVVIIHRLLLERSSTGAYKNLSLAAMTVLGAFAVVAYFNFLKVHDYGKAGNHVYHYHDIYHYSLGAKYYDELRYDRLYDCTYVALQDIGDEGIAIPHIVAVRSLANPDESYRATEKIDESRARCSAAFTAPRWQSFKHDLKVFLSRGWQTGWWRTMLFDLGFNPPPSWAVVATPLANLLPFESWTLSVLPFLDILLIFGVGAYFVRRAFGSFHLLAYYLVLGTNWYASYVWTGGSYFRQVWFGLLVLAVCSLKLKHLKLAGLFFGLAAALRLFPAAFFVGALWPLVVSYREPASRKAILTMSVVFGGTVAVVAAASLLAFGGDAWGDFFAKISKHNNTFFVMHFGFKKYAVFSDSIAGQNFWWEEGLKRAVAWNERLWGIYQDSIIRNTIIQLAVPAATFYVFRKYSTHFAAMAIGGTLLFFFSMPANYYYVYLALLVVVAMRTTEKRPTSLIAIGLWLALVGINVMRLTTKDWLLFNGYTNQILFGFFVALPLFGYLESSSRARQWFSQWLQKWENSA